MSERVPLIIHDFNAINESCLNHALTTLSHSPSAFLSLSRSFCFVFFLSPSLSISFSRISRHSLSLSLSLSLSPRTSSSYRDSIALIRGHAGLIFLRLGSAVTSEINLASVCHPNADTRSCFGIWCLVGAGVVRLVAEIQCVDSKALSNSPCCIAFLQGGQTEARVGFPRRHEK